MMIGIETSMTNNEAPEPENLHRRMDPTDETTAVTDAGMDGLLPLGRLEANRVRPRFWVFLLKHPKICSNSR
jgi:hypothetical protein